MHCQPVPVPVPVSMSGSVIDTSGHTSECLCSHCKCNGTGPFAQRAAADVAQAAVDSDETGHCSRTSPRLRS